MYLDLVRLQVRLAYFVDVVLKVPIHKLKHEVQLLLNVDHFLQAVVIGKDT